MAEEFLACTAVAAAEMVAVAILALPAAQVVLELAVRRFAGCR